MDATTQMIGKLSTSRRIETRVNRTDRFSTDLHFPDKYAGPPHSRTDIYAAAHAALASSSYRSIPAAGLHVTWTANPPAAAVYQRDRQTDRHMDGRTLDRSTTPHSMKFVKNSKFVIPLMYLI